MSSTLRSLTTCAGLTPSAAAASSIRTPSRPWSHGTSLSSRATWSFALMRPPREDTSEARPGARCADGAIQHRSLRLPDHLEVGLDAGDHLVAQRDRGLDVHVLAVGEQVTGTL